MKSVLATVTIGLVVFNSLAFSVFGQSSRGRLPIAKVEQSVVTAPAAPLSITTLGVALTENFDTLSNTAGSTTNVLTVPGWELTETGGGARDNEQYAVDTGGSATGDTYSYGSAASTDRALGGLQSGTLIPVFGASFTNNSGATITSLDMSYTGEQWRIANTGPARIDRIDFQYSLDATSLTTGAWTDADSLDFINPIQTNATAAALDGNAAANRTNITATVAALSIPNGATFYIRWTDLNAAGADDGLAVDDFSLTARTTTAADASISGRVLDAYGRAIRGAVVTVSGLDGASRAGTTNTFGYYNFSGIRVGESYVVSVTARRHRFAVPSYFVNLGDSVEGLDFRALP